MQTYFVFCNLRSFTETGNALYITQSAVSHAIKKLEGSVGTPLIVRKGNRYELTGAGAELYESCKCIFSELEKAEENLKKYQTGSVWQIYVGCTVEFGTTILIKYIKRFLQENPNIHLDFLFSHHLKKPLISEEVDLIIDCKNHFHQDIEKIFLFNEEYVIISSGEFMEMHHLESPADLDHVRILSLDKQAEWWSNFSRVLDSTSRPHFKNIMQINHLRGMINGAIEGLGVSFVPRYTVIDELKNGLLVNLFPHIRPLADQFCIYIKKEKLKLKKNILLIDYLRNIKPTEFGQPE